MNPRARAKVKESLEHAQAEAMALMEEHDAFTVGRLETRMERREDGTVVIRFSWEVSAPRP
ncbi:hypothetical protein [Streptomyces sp. NBC_01207]|uniref:hypothetical protein n=1 Tax=Streptomyces sp. NBC_01207 TaxID=2903772 RepID=UPI002E14E024|nr:hypothetical protein OG457_27385 [Streptomyces sp. NBC_01207]